MSEVPSTQPPSKAKKLPFKPTALRKPASKIESPTDKDNSQDEDGLDLFRRSKEMQPIMEAERERRLKKKKRQEEERKKSAAVAGKRPLQDGDDDDDGYASKLPSHKSPSVIRSTPPANANHTGTGQERSELVTPPASKRTRPSSTPKQNLSFTSTEPESFVHTSPSSSRAPCTTQERPKRDQGASLLSPPPGTIVLSDSDEDLHNHAPNPTPKKGGDDVEILGSGSAATDDDDEFADYIRKAAEQRRRQATSEAGRGSASAKDTILLLVTSVVPNSRPCQARFLYDKPLRVVKDTWFALQKQKGILTEVTDKDEIVLTWRRRKVYASSTLLNLGIRPDRNGRAVVDGLSSKGLDDNRTQVHMEAWTADLFQEMEREEELQRKRDAGELSEDEGSAPARDEPPVLEIKLRVILKARGLGDVKLTVRPETTVETLITGFRTQQPTACNKDVGIWFDGDRLEEHMTMDEAEIDDMDTLEVHIK